jgi:hypothetical protein
VPHDVAHQQLGQGVALALRHAGQARAQLPGVRRQRQFGQVGVAAAVDVGQLDVQAVVVGQPLVQFRHRVGPVLGVEQGVVDTGVAAVVAVILAGQPVPVQRRQIGQHFLRMGQAQLVVVDAAIGQAQQCLHLVDGGAADAGIHHQADRPARRQRAAQGAQAGVRVGQVMQHAGAVDVVEGAQPQRGDVEDRLLHPADVVELADGRAPLGDRDAGRTQVEVDDFGIGVPELLGQVDGGVAGAAAGHQRAESLREGLAAGEAVMVDHRH